MENLNISRILNINNKTMENLHSYRIIPHFFRNYEKNDWLLLSI